MGSYEDIADAKRGFMHTDGFEKILIEFPRAFDDIKPLCERIRVLLFPLTESGALNIGTPSDPPGKLYDAIIGEFDKAIDIAEAEGR